MSITLSKNELMRALEFYLNNAKMRDDAPLTIENLEIDFRSFNDYFTESDSLTVICKGE